MRGLLELTKLEFKLLLRFFMVVFFALVFPSMMLLMFGGIYGNEPTSFFGGYGTVDVSVPAYIAMVIAVTGIMTLPINITTYREKKILKRFMATPIRTTDILISQIFVNIMFTVMGVIILILVGKLVFNMQIIGKLPAIILVFILSLISVFSIGFIIASVCSNARTATVVSNLIYFPMIFLTGATIPLELMPDYMVRISKLLPVSYVVSLQKGIWLGGGLADYRADILILLSILIAGIVISVFTFKWE